MKQVLEPAPATAAKDDKQIKLESVERPAPGDQKEDPLKTYASAATRTKKAKTFKELSAGLTPEEEAEVQASH